MCDIGNRNIIRLRKRFDSSFLFALTWPLALGNSVNSSTSTQLHSAARAFTFARRIRRYVALPSVAGLAAMPLLFFPPTTFCSVFCLQFACTIHAVWICYIHIARFTDHNFKLQPVGKYLPTRYDSFRNKYIHSPFKVQTSVILYIQHIRLFPVDTVPFFK